MSGSLGAGSSPVALSQDGRQQLVGRTPVGKRRLDGALKPLLEYERALVAGLRDDQRRDLVRSLRQLLEKYNLPAH